MGYDLGVRYKVGHGGKTGDGHVTWTLEGGALEGNLWWCTGGVT